MDRKKVTWMIVSFMIAIVSIVMVIHQSKAFQMNDFLADIWKLNGIWILCSFVSMFGFIWFEGKAILRIAKALHVSEKAKSGVLYAAADVYFSAITPSASGGQPASAYFMMQDGMSASVIAITLLFNLIFYCVALLSIGSLTFLVYGSILAALSLQFKLLFAAGLCILAGLAALFYLLLNQERIIYGICGQAISFLERMKLIKNGNEKREKLNASMQRYKECAKMISKDKSILRDVYCYNVLQRLSQLGVTFFTFMAWKKDVILALRAMVVQSFVAVGSNCVPIPGAMGVADYMMLHGFSYLLGETDAVNMELLCRGITFYGCVITGGIITIIGYFSRRKKKHARIL